MPTGSSDPTAEGTSFYIIKTLRKIFHFIPVELRHVVVIALVLSRLDYCNALYLNITAFTLNKLQVIQNMAVCIILNIPKHASVREGMKALHWFPVRKHIFCKAIYLFFQALHHKGSSHLLALFNWYIPSRSLNPPLAGKSVFLYFEKLDGAAGPSPVLLPGFGILCPLRLPIWIPLLFKKSLKTWLFSS